MIAVLKDIGYSKAAYRDAKKARFRHSEEVKSGKY